MKFILLIIFDDGSSLGYDFDDLNSAILYLSSYDVEYNSFNLIGVSTFF